MYSANFVIYFLLLFSVATTTGEPLTCYTCSSESLDICATLNFQDPINDLPFEVCSEEVTSCYTKVSDGLTERGCLAPKATCTDGEIDDNDNQCLRCSGNKCNGNIYPPYRLYCSHCAGDDCLLPSDAVSVRYPCVNYTLADSCYSIFSHDGRTAYRGCMSDSETSDGRKFCKQNDDQCVKCANRNCNSGGVQWEKPLSCIVCDSTEDENCMEGTDGDRSACGNMTLGYQNHCFMRVDNRTVRRGCLVDASPDIVEDCNSWYTKTCSICQHDYCNQHPIEEEYCYECSSDHDPKCTNSVEAYMRKDCAVNLMENGCFRISNDADGQSIRRGCASELNETESRMCHIDDQNSCKLCTGSGCNYQAAPQSCYICSSQTNRDCAKNVTSSMITECQNYIDDCITLIDPLNNDAIVRNCLRNVFKDDTFCRNSPSLCELCTGDNCNAQPVADNLTCYTCDSAIDPNCRDNLNASMITKCALSANNLGCYHSVDENGLTLRRGCLSDLSPIAFNECEVNGTKCKTCDGPNCNDRNGIQKCYECDSTLDINCVRGVGAFEPVTCEAYGDVCYVHVVNDVVTRGCMRESTNIAIEVECADPDVCELCNGTAGCNGKVVDGEFCMECDSHVDPNCRTNMTVAMRTQCPLAVSRLGCYRFEDENNLVKRGCLSGITDDERNMCREQGKKCKTCRGDDCNARIAFQTCTVCNSTQSKSCIRGPSQFPAIMCTDYLDECFTHVRDDIVTRGCLREQPTIIEDCADRDMCAKCTGKARCNNRIVDGEFCLTCDSSVDPNCRTNVTFEMRTQCSLSPNRVGCYRSEGDGDVVKRGCLANIGRDERRMCREEGDSCKTCIGNDCNKKIDFQQCRVCNSNSTDSISCIRAPSGPVATCRNYTDVCYTHVRNDVVVRGCLSENVSQVIAHDCTKDKTADFCERCDGSNCNTHIINGEFCMTCDSLVDTNCRTNITFAMRTQCLLAVRPLGCYRFEDENQLVKRGCLADVTVDEREMCRDEEQKCKTCQGNDCNAKIAFQRCAMCRSSGNDDVCESNASSLDKSLCDAYLDDCFTHVRNNVTTRGCLLEQKNDLAGVDFQTDCLDSDLCRKCDNHDNCNVAPVSIETCGFQDGPENPFRPTQCPKAVAALGCYRTEDISGHSVRGCVSQLSTPQRRMCREEGDSCKTCTSNSTETDQLCNAVDSFMRCYGCDSSSNPNCAISPTDGMIRTCNHYNDVCFTSNSADNQVRRGCLNEMSTQFIAACKLDGKNCDICHGGVCNYGSVGIERCIECDSTTNPNCVNQLDGLDDGKVCNPDEPMRHQGCYLSAKNGHVKRGCVSDIVDATEKRICLDGMHGCKVCKGRLCNRKESFQNCYSCNSETNETCVQANATSTLVCDDYLDTCAIVLRSNGHMQRGCGKNFSPSDLTVSSQVSRCHGNNCNGNIFPADRLLCHRCNGADDCQYLENAANASTPQPCPIYVNGDKCFSSLQLEYKMYRGCQSDASQIQENCQAEPGHCTVCTGNGCNVHDRSRRPTLDCVYCDRTNDCAYGQMPESMITAACHNDVLFKRSETCYIDRTLTGVHRGCTLDVRRSDNWCNDRESCTMCTGNQCNRKNAFPQLCYKCNGTGCEQEQNETSLIVCPGIFGRGRAGCYTNVKDDHSVVRGCFNDLTDQQISDCSRDEHCTWCLADYCNGEESDAIAATVSTLLLVASIIFVQTVTK